MHIRFLSTPVALATASCLFATAVVAYPVDGGEPRAAGWRAHAPEADHFTDRLIVKYRQPPTTATAARSDMAAQVAGNRQGVQMTRFRQMANGAHVMRMSRRMSRSEAEALAANLRSGDANIEYAEPDRLLQAMVLPNDAMLTQQWSLSDTTGGIRAPAAWEKSTGKGVVVAVIDTGVRRHADLAANLLAGYDFITDTFVSGDGNGREADALDPGDFTAAGYCGSGSAEGKSSWHGTHVAGIVAAVGANGVGVAGIAYGAKVLPLRVLGKCGGYTSDIADAIVWAAGGSVSGVPVNPNPAKVINLSLGGSGACDLTTQTAINTARAKGAVVVVAAGNANTDAALSSPANCSGVIAVAATGKSGGKASYSNTGANVTLAAPGGDSGAGILSTLNAGASTPTTDSYAAYMGTSMATPAVSAVAALMFAVNAKLTPDQVAAMLKTSARAFPAPCPKCGAGIVDANAAVALAAAAAAPAPAPTPAPVQAPTPAPTPSPATAPTPAPGPITVKEAEPNNSVAQAQNVATLPATVTGTMASISDSDYYKATVGAGKKLTVTLTAGSTSGFGLGIFTATGQQLIALPGVTGRQQQIVTTNASNAATQLVVRVYRSAGAIGAYTLTLAY